MGGAFKEPRGTYQQSALGPSQMFNILSGMDVKQLQREMQDSLFQQRFQDINKQAETETNSAIYRTVAETSGVPEKEVERYLQYFPGVTSTRDTALQASKPQVVETQTGLLAPLGLGTTKRSMYVPQRTLGVTEGLVRQDVQQGMGKVREQSMFMVDRIVENQPELKAAGESLKSQMVAGPLVHPSDVPAKLKEMSLTGIEGVREATERGLRVPRIQEATAKAISATEDAAVSQATRRSKILLAESEASFKQSQALVEQEKARYAPEMSRVELATKKQDLDTKSRDYHNLVQADKVLNQYRQSVAQGVPNPEILKNALTFYGFPGANALLNMDSEQQKTTLTLVEATMKGRLSLHESLKNLGTDPTLAKDIAEKQNRLEHYLATRTGAATVRMWSVPSISGLTGSTPTIGSVEVPTEFASMMLTGMLPAKMASSPPEVQAMLAAYQILTQRPYLQASPQLVDETVKDYFKGDQQIFPSTVDPQLVMQFVSRLVGSARPQDVQAPFVPGTGPRELPGVNPYSKVGGLFEGVPGFDISH